MTTHDIDVSGEAVLVQDVRGTTLKYGQRKGQRMTFTTAVATLPTTGKAPRPGDRSTWHLRLVGIGPVAFALERLAKDQTIRFSGRLALNAYDQGGARITQLEVNLSEVGPAEAAAAEAPALPAEPAAEPAGEMAWDPARETAEEFMARVEKSLAPGL